MYMYLGLVWSVNGHTYCVYAGAFAGAFKIGAPLEYRTMNQCRGFQTFSGAALQQTPSPAPALCGQQLVWLVPAIPAVF